MRRAVPTIMNTVKRGLDYYVQEFGPYVFGSFRIFEYPRYSTVVDARLAAIIAFNEGAGFFSNYGDRQIDFVTGHELGAHVVGRSGAQPGPARHGWC